MKNKILKGRYKEDRFFLEEEEKQQRELSKGMGEYNDGIFSLHMYEIAYLIEEKGYKIISNIKELTFDTVIKKRNFNMYHYVVFKDLKQKGYHIGSGLKFGAIFRLYEKGSRKEVSKIHNDHSKWLVFILSFSKSLSANDFSAYNRLAHSTKKQVLLAIVDSELDVTYYEISWKKNP
jgi:tRNA-intron endonuclease